MADYIPKGKGGWKTYIARAKGIKLCEEIKPFLLKPEDGIQKTVLVLRFQSISIRYDDEGEYPEDLSPSDLKMVKVSETTLDDVIRCTTESGSLNDSFNTPQSIKAVFGA